MVSVPKLALTLSVEHSLPYVAAPHSDLIGDAAMRLRRTRLDPWPFPWIQAFPGANRRSYFRTVLLTRTAASA
jgi:hypothetical protein